MKLRVTLLLCAACVGALLALSSCAGAYPEKEFQSTRAGNDNTYPETYRAPSTQYNSRR